MQKAIHTHNSKRSLLVVDSKDNLYNPDTANFLDGSNMFGFKPRDATQDSYEDIENEDSESQDADLGPEEADEKKFEHTKKGIINKNVNSNFSSRSRSPLKDTSHVQRSSSNKGQKAVVQTPAFGTTDKGFFKESKMKKKSNTFR